MDYYDKAVEYLTNRPQEIKAAWSRPEFHRAGKLFSYVERHNSDKSCGCLTQIRDGDEAETEELTNAIRADDRIPICQSDIRVEHLQVFAEWQRRIDAELGRRPPVWREPC